MKRVATISRPPVAAKAKLFRNGQSQAVRLPKEFRFEGNEVSIRREGRAVVMEPLTKRPWPTGYWAKIDRKARDLNLGTIEPLGGKLLDLGADDV